MMRSVRARLQRLFRNSKANVIVVANTKTLDSNFLYLSGFPGGVFERDFIIATPKEVFLLTSPLEYEIAMRLKPKEMRVLKAKSMDDISRTFKKLMKGKILGINGNFLPYNYYRLIKKYGKPKRVIDVSALFAEARAVKEDSEVAKIRIANRMIKKAIGEAQKRLKTGMTEKDVASMITDLSMEYGADGPSFDPIVCFGANSALPHHRPTNAKLQPNSLVLMDCGAKYEGYCSDVTRTMVFKPSRHTEKYKRMARMYSVVRNAQKLALTKIKPGAKGAEAHNAASKYIDGVDKGEFKGKFIHGLGHPIGLEVHDVGPALTPGEKRKLKPGMVVSDEPGVYIVGFGGVRIEDDVLVTKNGSKMM